MIAALYVEKNGPYAELDGVDVWDIKRDARKYRGPHKVIAHPPCKRWGSYWFGGPSAKERRLLGDDDGCFAAALWAVRTFGGVLEHPKASHAWNWFGIRKPPKDGMWIRADSFGFTCCVEQGHYGHEARKATWLYAVNCPLKDLRWGPASGKTRLDEGFKSTKQRHWARAQGVKRIKRLSDKVRMLTPIEFRDTLIDLVHENKISHPEMENNLG